MKKTLKISLFLAGFLMLFTGCSVNYCSDADIERIKESYSLKTSIYVVDQVINIVNNDEDASNNIVIPQAEDQNVINTVYSYLEKTDYSTIVENNVSNNAQDASTKIKSYFLTEGMDAKVENPNYIKLNEKLNATSETDGKSLLTRNYSNVKKALDIINNDKTLRQTSTCLTIDGNDKEPTSGANLEEKNWGYAWKKGPLQGLITYPIAFGLATFTKLIGDTGIGQILSILFVTIIVRLIITLATFKQTMQQQKMQLIQPELNAIQVKYQGKTDQVSKQKMGQEMMRLYQKYDVHPFKSLIMPFISMPVFICVYHAVNNTAILKSGKVFNVNLGDAMSTGILAGRWFAIVLFILMVAIQYVSMKLPQWIQKYKNKDRRPDPRIEQAQKQTNTMTTVFFVMIIFMGWMLPTSMTVYWIASSLVSVGQTLISQKLMGNKSKKDLVVKKKK